MPNRIFVLLSLFVCVLTASAQSGPASLTGVVIGPNGRPVPNAPVQAKSKSTTAVGRGFTAENGRYTLSGLAAGVYEVSVTMPCCAFAPFVKDVSVNAGEAHQFDIRLAEGGSLNTYGDDPGVIGAMLRKRNVVPKRAAPRTANGTPDLSGVWLVGEDPYPEKPETLPAAQAAFQERLANNNKDHPHTRCLPGSPPVDGGATPFMAKMVQTPSLIVILTESVIGFRQIFLDGRKHPADPDPTWNGHSVGKWEGDTLVVDTVGFNDRGLTGPYPRTERLHMIERYRRVDYGHLELDVTYEDPGVFSKPWHLRSTWDFAPKEELIEFICENNKAQNMVGK